MSKKDEQGPTADVAARTVYPDAQAIFSGRQLALDAIKDDCCVVLDTNVLLVPFDVGKDSLEQLRRTYQKLAKQKRLIVPGHVAREFARNRASKLVDLYKSLSQKRNFSQLQKGTYPLLEGLPAYTELGKLEVEIDRLLRSYKDAVDRVLDLVSEWNWNDPVSQMYAELFVGDVVYDPEFDAGELAQDLAYRQQHKIPPGYKDAAKEDNNAGDLLIWHTILRLAKSRSKNVLFVSHDKKSDWWHRSDGRALYPRYELVDEFRRLSGGGTFHVAELSRLMALYGASDDVVSEVKREEVRREEVQVSSETSSTPFRDAFVTGGVASAMKAERAVISWLRGQPGATVLFGDHGGPRFVCNGSVEWLVVRYFDKINAVDWAVRDLLEHVRQFLRKQPEAQVLLVVVARGMAAARHIAPQVLAVVRRSGIAGVRCLVGHVSSDGNFCVDDT
ncbi:PIN domain-containing protein [Sorangium cellulosum]|uniref:PIN domain-containing protein n=1 Tax=Sorangium cellulosum TaxID=56 RepID=UPI000406FC67|nr:PIN domain-containing protein [Sorangium cellulosum]